MDLAEDDSFFDRIRERAEREMSRRIDENKIRDVSTRSIPGEELRQMPIEC
jgi:hypothetical protein